MSSYPRIYAVVRRIPAGRVATYGQVAELAGVAGQARLVGYAMAALEQDSPVPWHRVINAQGRVSPRAGEPAGSMHQRLRLELEGVQFDARGRVPLDRFGWQPRGGARKPDGSGGRVNAKSRSKRGSSGDPR